MVIYQIHIQSVGRGISCGQHRNIFSHNTVRLAKFGWILTYLEISLEMALINDEYIQVNSKYCISLLRSLHLLATVCVSSLVLFLSQSYETHSQITGLCLAVLSV